MGRTLPHDHALYIGRHYLGWRIPYLIKSGLDFRRRVVSGHPFSARGGGGLGRPRSWAETVPSHARSPIIMNKNPIILAVDDDPNDLLFLEAAFKFIGISTNVHTVGGGHEAIAYLNGEGEYADRGRYPYPDFILTDLKMPGVDGFEVLEFLRKTPEFSTIRAVVLSGSQDADDIRNAYRLGASGYLVKPSSPIELRKIVKTLHDFWVLCESPAPSFADGEASSDGCGKLDERAAAGVFSSESRFDS